MLYIRHSHKSYTNGSVSDFSLDPGLTEQGRKIAYSRFLEMIRIHGIPSRIISSPYLRARETSQIACDVLSQLFNISLDIIYDPNIGEYLGHHLTKDINICLRPDTLAHNPIPPEPWKFYINRVRRHVNTSLKYSGLTWYITHGIIIKSVAFFHGYTIDYPKELSGIRIDGSIVSTI